MFDEDTDNSNSDFTYSIQLFQISFNGVHFNYPARKDVPILRGWIDFVQARYIIIDSPYTNFPIPVSMVMLSYPQT